MGLRNGCLNSPRKAFCHFQRAFLGKRPMFTGIKPLLGKLPTLYPYLSFPRWAFLAPFLGGVKNVPVARKGKVHVCKGQQIFLGHHYGI